MEDETGETWLRMNPARSARQSRAILVQFVSRTVGEDEARKKVGSWPVRVVADAIERVEDDRPDEYHNGAPVVDPKADAGAPETT